MVVFLVLYCSVLVWFLYGQVSPPPVNAWSAPFSVHFAGSPKNVSYTAVKQDLENIDGVRTAHNLHMWCLTMGKSALAVHLAIGESVAVRYCTCVVLCPSN